MTFASFPEQARQSLSRPCLDYPSQLKCHILCEAFSKFWDEASCSSKSFHSTLFMLQCLWCFPFNTLDFSLHIFDLPLEGRNQDFTLGIRTINSHFFELINIVVSISPISSTLREQQPTNILLGLKYTIVINQNEQVPACRVQKKNPQMVFLS